MQLTASHLSFLPVVNSSHTRKIAENLITHVKTVKIVETIRNLRFYNSGNLATLKSGKGAVTIFRNQDTLFAEQFTDSAIDVKLLSTDNHKSVINTKNGNGQELFSYTPYGYCQAIAWSSTASGFNGEYLEPATDNYMLGNGYRACSPRQRRFICTDSESPFGIGGLNAYAYCLCDPINNIDPDGHGTVDPFKIFRHLKRSITGTHYKHFQKKYDNAIENADNALKEITHHYLSHKKTLNEIGNNKVLRLNETYAKNESAFKTGTIAEEQIAIVEKNLAKAKHYSDKILKHIDDAQALEHIDHLLSFAKAAEFTSDRMKSFIDYAATIRNSN